MQRYKKLLYSLLRWNALETTEAVLCEQHLNCFVEELL